MGADFSFDVKNIEIWAPTFFNHNNLFVATMCNFGEQKKMLFMGNMFAMPTIVLRGDRQYSSVMILKIIL